MKKYSSVTLFLISMLVWLPLSLRAEASVASKLQIDNAFFKVSRDSVCEFSGLGKCVIVALSHTTIKSGKIAMELDRGEVAVFNQRESLQVLRGDFFQVILKADHPPLKRPDQWIEPVKNKIVFEDSEFRIFEERLAAHDVRELHSHAQRIVVRLNRVQLTDPRFHQVPVPGTGIQEPNTVKYAEPVVHEVKNTSDIPLFNIVIEYKLAQ